MAIDTDLVIIVGGIFATTVGYQVSRAFARRMEARGAGDGQLAEIRHRLAAIETAVDTIAIEIERVAESQRFSARLQAGPPPQLPPQS